jgi:dolichol-phosphate mannosyltransferase
MKTPQISVIVPVYGCAGCLEVLCYRLTSVLSVLSSSYEVILVDDRSADGAWAQIENIAKEFDSIYGVRLSRNFGQHVAMTAGLECSRGEYVILIDCDLQDPPEIIPTLVEKINEGYDYVLARRISRTTHSLRVFASTLYFAVFNRLNSTNIDPACGTLSILSRKVVNAILSIKDRDRNLLFLLNWVGFNSGYIDYHQEDRPAGKSSYKLSRLLIHAVDGLLLQSANLLYWVVGFGFFMCALSLLLGIFLVCSYWLYGSIKGWTSLAVSLLFCTSIILISMGIIGSYIGKIFNQTKPRPIYIIDAQVKSSSLN